MLAFTEMLTAGKAAVVAGVEPRVVNDAIGRQIMPPALWTAEPRQRLALEGCLLVTFYNETGDRPTREERLRGIREVSSTVMTPRVEPLASSSDPTLAANRWTFVTKNSRDFRDAAERSGVKGQYIRLPQHEGLVGLNGSVGMDLREQKEPVRVTLDHLCNGDDSRGDELASQVVR